MKKEIKHGKSLRPLPLRPDRAPAWALRFEGLLVGMALGGAAYIFLRFLASVL